MATMTTGNDLENVAQEIVGRVRPYLEHNPIGETAPEILEEALHLEEGWWYIPIRLQAGKMRAYEYYDLLTDIEDEIKEREHLMVLFVPAN